MGQICHGNYITIVPKVSIKMSITASKEPTKMSSQMVAIKAPNGSTNNINQHDSLCSTPWAHQDVHGSYHSTQWIITVSNRPNEVLTNGTSNMSPEGSGPKSLLA